MNQSPLQQASRHYSIALAFLGLISGMFLSYGVLSGDQQGQVNFLFLLIVFVFLPVLALLLSLILLLRRGGKGLAGWLLELPIWPTRLKTAALQISSKGESKHWFVYHSQLFSVGFSIGCLALYFLLLLTTDITFVWRSTLLEAEQLLPALRILGAPWAFWPEAQASLTLLEQSRDFRLESVAQPTQQVGQWWRYVFAAQCTYSLLPRSVMLVVARHRFREGMREQARAAEIGAEPRPREPGQPHALAEVITGIDSPHVLLGWGSIPRPILENAEVRFGKAVEVKDVGPFDAASVTGGADASTVLVVVKSWEPPLAELADFLLTLNEFRQRALLPVDWEGEHLRAVTEIHLNEWRRFCATLPGWHVLQEEKSS